MLLLTERTSAGITVLTDERLRAEHGVLVAFSKRAGGFSTGDYAGLNLAAHVGDDAELVDANRTALLASLGIAHDRERLTTAHQVHGTAIGQVGEDEIGAGAFAEEGSRPSVRDADGLMTVASDVPLMLCFADCVPIILVATKPVVAVVVAHAGWRGALAGIAGAAARALAARAGCETADLVAYVGPHIGACHYEVAPELLSQFVHTFGTIAAAQGRLDLGAVVSESLNGVGVPISSQCSANVCTAERTDVFFSHRAEGPTGRHGALACILGDPR